MCCVIFFKKTEYLSTAMSSIWGLVLESEGPKIKATADPEKDEEAVKRRQNVNTFSKPFKCLPAELVCAILW